MNLARGRSPRYAFGFTAALVAAATAHAFPWGDRAPALGPRDAAFAPITVASVERGVEWGVPLVDGPVRMVLVAPRFALRDAAELARRLDVRAETVALWDATHFGRPDAYGRDVPGTSHDDTLRDLLEKLDGKLDVIVAANFDFGILPPEAFQRISEKVRGGTGLVLAHHRHTLPDALKEFLGELVPAPGGAAVTHGVGETLTAEWKPGLGFVQCGTIGQGRVVEMDYQGEWPLTHCLTPALTNPLVAEDEDLDTYLSLAARAVRWAAGRDATVTVASVRAKPAPRPEDVQIPPGLERMVDANLPVGASLFHSFVLELAAPADRTYTVRSGVRQRGRGQAPITIAQDRDPLRKGTQSYEFYVVAGAGEYWLDVWLLDDGKVAEWYSQAVTIDAWPSIADLALSKSSILPQDSVGITFSMPARQRPCIAYARAVDPLGRIVAERNHAVEPSTALVKLGLGFADLLGDMVKVEVFVVERDLPTMPDWDKRICAYAYKFLPVRGTSPVDRLSIVAGPAVPVEFNARAFGRGLAQLGVTTLRTPATEEALRAVPWLGLRALPEITSYAPYQSPPAAVRSPCLNDPAFIASEQAYLKSAAQIVRDYAAPGTSLGGSNALSVANEDVCRCPHCIAAFGEYLRKQYGDLAALNASWGAAFDTWDAIAPPTMQEARAAQRYAPWVDFRLFMDSVFLNTHTAARAVVRTADPRARCGIAVTQSADELYSGHDWAALAQQLDLLAAPADLRIVETVRSTRGLASLAGIEVPADSTPEHLRWLPWHAVLHRAPSVWWPDITASTANVPAAVGLDPLGRPVPFAPECFAEAAALDEGPAQVWLHSQRPRPDVAIVTGRASAWLNEVDNRFGASSAGSERAFVSALSALGYAFDVVPAHRLAKGALTGYRVAVLPMARALSDAETAAVRSFAASGGFLIADVAPGAFDEHGAPRETSPLAEVFGVRYVKASAPAGPATALVELHAGGGRAAGEFVDVRADASVEPVDARPGGLAGAVPVWLLRGGPPAALLLNHAITEHALDAAHGMLDAVLRDAGARRVTDLGLPGDREFHGERFAAAYGSAALVALLADPDAPRGKQEVRLRFDRQSHVYDLRTGLPVARPKKVDVELEAGGAALYSVLPYDVVACNITVPPTSALGARMPLHVAVETGGAAPGDHLVRIEVFAVTTETLVPLPHYSQEIVCAKGEGDAFVPFALNDRATRHRIVARDLLSGAKGEAFVNLSIAAGVQ